jgi:hypothetical protein
MHVEIVVQVALNCLRYKEQTGYSVVKLGTLE